MAGAASLLTVRAPAKVNLTLAVLGRRSDGYHELESLVTFAGSHDLVSLEPGKELALTVTGPRAAGLESDGANLVLRAADALARRVPGLVMGRFGLVKRLPVAAGIGGGSANAAAALRLLARVNGLPLAHPALRDAARETGADVTVCLAPRARMMRGAGEAVGPPLALPQLFAVLANPGVAVATADVFRALGLKPGSRTRDARIPNDAPNGGTDWAGFVAAGRNDLEAPARALAPAIDDALMLLAASPGCRLARMSGSGATCFGLFSDCGEAAAAASALRRQRPHWWVRPTILR